MHRHSEPAATTGGRSGLLTPPASPPEAPAAQPAEPQADVVLDELLVEDVSIDGMCGVY